MLAHLKIQPVEHLDFVKPELEHRVRVVLQGVPHVPIMQVPHYGSLFKVPHFSTGILLFWVPPKYLLLCNAIMLLVSDLAHILPMTAMCACRS